MSFYQLLNMALIIQSITAVHMNSWTKVAYFNCLCLFRVYLINNTCYYFSYHVRENLQYIVKKRTS